MTALPLDRLYTTSVTATSLTGEAADRVAIRELQDAWAHCADRRLAQQQTDLFTADGVVAIYQGSDPAASEPVATHRGKAEILDALAILRHYDLTTHFNGQSDFVIDGDRASGELYCLAHHLWMRGGERTLMLMSIRYHDTMVRVGGRWLFQERKLITDWTDTRPSNP
jgi:hypothetical protein